MPRIAAAILVIGPGRYVESSEKTGVSQQLWAPARGSMDQGFC